MNGEIQYHIGLSSEDSARYAVICGDPARVPVIAACLDDCALVAYNREFQTYSGYLCGEKVLITSTGIGGPSAAIAIEELHNIGVDTIIRVGTCGGMSLDVLPGDLVIAQAAVRMDGTTREYAPIEFPAAADFLVTQALAQECEECNYRYKIGTVQSKDSFYGQHSPQSSAVSSELAEKWKAWKMCGVLSSEMECSTLFVVSALRGIRAGAVLNTIWNQERESSGCGDIESHDMKNAVSAAIGAMRRLILWDKDRR